MLYREIMAVCSEVDTNHINKLCGQNVELLNVELVVRILATSSRRIARLSLNLNTRWLSVVSITLRPLYLPIG